MVTSEFGGWDNPSSYIDENGVRAVPGTQKPNRLPWSALLKPDRISALGEYDARDPAVTRWHREQMRKAGVDVVCIQIDWSHKHTRPEPWYVPLPSPMLNAWGVENHPADCGVKFCLSFWDVMTGPEGMEYFATELRGNRGWSIVTLENSFRLFARAVAQFMLRPDYWRIDGKPVLYRGWAHTLPFYSERFGFEGVTARRITDIWRDEIKSIVGVEPYLVATSVADTAYSHIGEWGFDCFTHYLLHGKGWANTMEVYRGRWASDPAMCRQQKIDYIVPITAGYDGSAWNTGESQQGYQHMPTAAEFTAHVREGRQIALANPDICKAVASYAWDENGEGGIMQPMQPGMLHDGDELLRAHREACT